MTLRAGIALLAERAAARGYPHADRLYKMTPREAALALRAFCAEKSSRYALLWTQAVLTAAALHCPRELYKLKPPAPDMSADEMKRNLGRKCERQV